jgi:hypothetical protein
MFRYFFSFYLISLCFALNGQKVFQPKQVNINTKGVIYNEERAYDFRIHQSGFSFGYIKGELLTYYKTKYYFVEFGHMKDPRERRQNKNISFPSEGSSTSYTYGKRNSFFQIRAGIGRKRYLSEKAKRKGLAVGVNYQAGLTLGLLKPYYLKLLVIPEDNITNSFLDEQKYSEENHDKFIDDNDIFGGSSFFKGIEETSITVGAHGKLGLHFALGAYDKSVKAIETGIMVDIFPKKVPILVERDEVANKFYFLNLYINLQLGGRK